MKKKRHFCKLVLGFVWIISVIWCMNGVVFAEETSNLNFGDFSYEIYGSSEDKIRITKYNGSAQNLSIPSEIDGKMVDEIDYEAFKNCDTLISVDMSDSIYRIGRGAFRDCKKLEQITLSKNISKLPSSMFSGCINLKEVDIPESVRIIGCATFDDCRSMEKVIIPKNVESIGVDGNYVTINDGVFSGCFKLCEILVDEDNENFISVEGVLYSKDKKELLAYPENKGAKFQIPDGVTLIGTSAFKKNKNIEEIIMPDSVTSVGGFCFYECENLKRVKVSPNITIFDGYSFFGCKCLEEIEIPDKVETIWTGVFSYCESLKNIFIPKSVTLIRGWDFAYCKNLTEITVDPDNPNYSSVDGILYNKDQTRLLQYPNGKAGSLYISSKVENGDNSLPEALNHSDNLTSITVDPNNPIYSSIDGCLLNKEQTILYIVPGGWEGDYVMPDSVSAVSDYTVWDCAKLKSITLGKKVVECGRQLFPWCDQLENIFVNPENPVYQSVDGVLYQRKSGDYESATLLQYPQNHEGKQYIVPQGTKEIGGYAFRGCRQLENLVIPDSVSSIGDYLFYESNVVKKVTILSKTLEITKETFADCEDDLIIECYEDSEAYRYGLALGMNVKIIESIPVIPNLPAFNVTVQEETEIKDDLQSDTKESNLPKDSDLEKGNNLEDSKQLDTSLESVGSVNDLNENLAKEQDLKKISAKVLAKVTSLKLQNKKAKKAKATWKKVSAASGYQLQCALNKKFTKGKKSWVTKKTTYTIKKLTEKKTYYIRVRAYEIKTDGEKKFGKWSVVKKVKIKK